MIIFPFGKWLCADNVVKISCKRCDEVSFVICNEPMMNGPTTDKSQRFPLRARAEVTFNHLGIGHAASDSTHSIPFADLKPP